MDVFPHLLKARIYQVFGRRSSPLSKRQPHRQGAPSIVARPTYSPAIRQAVNLKFDCEKLHTNGASQLANVPCSAPKKSFLAEL